MAKEPIEAVVTDITESTSDAQSGFKAFTMNHPRTAKVVGYAAVTTAVLGAVAWWNAKKQSEFEEEHPRNEDGTFTTKSEIA